MRDRTINIDLNEGNSRSLRYKQFDNNNILKIIIKENKQEVDLLTYTARVFFNLPSNTILEKDAIIEDNKIVISLDNCILSESGRIITEIVLSNSNQIVTTFKMYLDVESSIDRNEAIQSMPEWDMIVDVIDNIDKKVDKVEGKSLVDNTEIERLSNVDNYDDTELRNLISTKSDAIHNHDTQYATKSSEHTHSNKEILDEITDLKITEWNEKSDFSGDYNDLINQPTIPIVDVNKEYVDTQLATKSDTTHTHNELHTHDNKDILDTITNEKIAEWDNHFSGSYDDLTEKPTIPSTTNELVNDSGFATETYVTNAIADAQLGGEDIDLSGYATKDELNAKANLTDIPTKTSQLINDDGFITDIPNEYVTETELNEKGYLTEHQDISGKVDKIEGMGLSQENFTTEEKTKLTNIKIIITNDIDTIISEIFPD